MKPSMTREQFENWLTIEGYELVQHVNVSYYTLRSRTKPAILVFEHWSGTRDDINWYTEHEKLMPMPDDPAVVKRIIAAVEKHREP